MILRTLIITCVVLLATCSQLIGNEATSPTAEIAELYRQGSPDKARESLIKLLRPMLVKPERGFADLNRTDTNAYLAGPSVATGYLIEALEFEQMYQSKNPPPEPFLMLISETLERLENVQIEIEESPFKNNDRIVAMRPYLDTQRKSLLIKSITFYRNLGQKELLSQLIADNQQFLRSNSIPVESIAPKAVEPVPADALPSEPWQIDGPSLPVLAAVMTYYRGLAEEDPAILQSVLHEEDGYVTGKELLQMLQEEKKRKGIDFLLEPIFDSRSSMTITKQPDSTLSVTIDGITKRLQIGVNLVSQRESDRFVVSPSGSEFRIMIKENKK